MQSTSKAEAFCRVAFVAVLSFVLFVSPLARVEDDPLGLIKWFVAHCSAYAMLAFLVSSWALAGRVRLFNTPFLLPILLMVCLSALSLIWAAPRFESINRMRYILISWAPFFLCVLAPIERRLRRIAAVSLVVGVSICSAIGVIQYLGVFETIWEKLPWEPELGKRVFSTMWNPNFLAGLLILTLPLILAFARTSRKRWFNIAFLALYFLNFSCLLFTNSWGGWAGYVASLILLAALKKLNSPVAPAGPAVGAKRHKATSRPIKPDWAVARGVLILVCLVTAVAFFASKGKTVAGTTVGVSEREKMWNSTMMLIKRRPMGVGVGNFAVFENKHEHEFIEPLKVTTAEFRKDRDNLLHNSLYCHNEFLETALETGFAGLVLLFWLILTMGRLPFRGRPRAASMRENKNTTAVGDRLMIHAVTAGAVAVIAQSIVSYPLRVPTTVTTLAALLGLFAPRRQWLELEFRIPQTLKYAAVCIALLGATYSCIGGYRPLDAEAFYVKGMKHLLADRDYASAREKYERAIALGLPRYNVYFRLGESQLRLRQFDLALKTYQRALELQPYHEYSFFGIAEASRGLGRLDIAIRNYKKAIEYEPRFLDAYLELAKLERSKGRAADAVRTLDMGLKYIPEGRELALDAAVASVERGAMKQAEIYLGNIPSTNQTDAVLLYDLRILRDARPDQSITPSAIAARMIDSEGAKWLLTLSKMGAVFVQKGKYIAARREFETILNRFPGYPPALSNIGTTYFLEGDTAHAESYLLQAISLAPEHVSYRAALADIYTSLRQWDAAEAQLLKAQRLDPSNTDIRKRLQWLKQQRGPASARD